MSSQDLPAHVRVAVVGSGFAGIGMGVRLLEEGERDFVLLERADDLGGTWRDNVYPGCACDVPSHLYSFSFAPNPGWSRTFSGQAEIWAYLRRVSDERGVTGHIRFGADVTGADWDAAAQVWRITTVRGDLTADVLVSGSGALSDPAFPRIEGLEDFTGTVFHSARWRHDHDLNGRKVAVIGTGASAIQFVPVVVEQAASVDVYQRTPPWIMPRPDRGVTAVERAVYRRLPKVQQGMRGLIYSFRELGVLGFIGGPKAVRLAQLRAERHLAKQVPDPVLRAKLTPSYALGCKRVLLSDDYLPALTREHVEVVTDPIARVTPTGVVSADGTVREVDTIILGTGFRISELPFSQVVRDADGRVLSDVWAGSPNAYRGSTVAGYPNLFFLVGPNTGLGHSSMVYMIESQVAYVVDALRTLRRTGAAAVEVRSEKQAEYRDWIQRKMEGTVWTSGGCDSWYLDDTGRNATLWPSFTFRFRAITAEFDADAYVLHAPAAERELTPR